MGVTINLQGINKVLGDINALPAKLKPEIKGELEEASRRFVAQAKRDAPGDQGLLRGEISYQPTGDLQFEVVSATNYAGFIEFGTRTRVQVPAGLEAVAAELRNGGTASSLTAKQAIYDWCKRKGIAPRLWFPIYRSVMTKGIKAHPYFFKQIEDIQPRLIQNIKRVIESID